jgi:hypothetical protein
VVLGGGHKVSDRGSMISIRADQPARDTPTYFQYVSKKSLTVIGRETHRLYRFDGPGAVVAIEKRDKRSLEAVPTLRLVRKIYL